jgi:hypothetical protein
VSVPPPPPSLPEQPAPPARKYLRPRRPFSWAGLLLGIALGVGSGLFYAWGVNPVVEFDTEPWQLSRADKAHYIAAIMLDYSQDSDLNQAVNRLLELRLPGDPIQSVADIACELASSGYVDSSSGLRAIRAMMLFYRLQGKSGCADVLIPGEDPLPTTVVNVVVPTPTLVPPPTKTPTPEPPAQPTTTQVVVVVPTSPPQSDFVLVNVSTFCDAAISGMIEVFVQDSGGDGLPGQEIRVRWDAGEDRFFSGLKPERGAGYADFQMQTGVGYLVDLPGRADPTDDPLVATPCETGEGERAVTSYRVVFRET